MPSLLPEQDGFDGVWLAELEMLLFVVFDQLGEKLKPGALGGPPIRIERYQPVHLLKIEAVQLFRLDDADVYDRCRRVGLTRDKPGTWEARRNRSGRAARRTAPSGS